MILSEVAAANAIIGLVFILGAVLGFLIGRRRSLPSHISISQAEVNNIVDLKKINKQLEEQKRILEGKEIALTLANKRLAKLEEAKSKFVAVTTHQLRTPLSAIKWTFNMVIAGQLGPISAEQKEVLDKGYKSTERMIGIVNDLLSVDKIEIDQKDYEFVPIQLEELIESLLYEFSNQADSNQIKLLLKKPSHPLPAVEVDALKLRAVLENLIDNAIKYNHPQGRVEIFIDDTKVNSVRNSIEIIISDTGIGIPAEERVKIFSKFFRASNAIKTEPDGSGLGLYLAKDIIEKHHGTIRFETSAAGTKFHLELPLHQGE
ncbi:MAG: HAMP domain-containing sensor histidine kinase [bacterium]|nr:HAMP domain-containing sensor histidine kinase [bacterium]